MHGWIQGCRLGLGGCSHGQVKSRLRCKACQIFQLVVVRSSPKLNFMWNEVTGLFSRDQALIAGCEWTTPDLLCVLILMELFSVVLIVYVVTGLLCRRQLLDCAQVLYTFYYSKSLAFPSWSLTWPFDFFSTIMDSSLNWVR